MENNAPNKSIISGQNNSDKNIELRSEKVRNIIGQIPPILIRQGTLIIGISLVAMVIISAFIPYQETLPIEVTINTIPQIEEINATKSGIFILNDTAPIWAEKGSLIGHIYQADSLLLVSAPISGSVVFNVQNYEKIYSSELICIVVPDDSLYYYGEAIISKSDINKVGVNQKVFLQISQTDDLIGHISKVSTFSSKNGNFKVVINFNDNVLPTSFGSFKGNIIISETTVLMRFLRSLKINI